MLHKLLYFEIRHWFLWFEFHTNTCTCTGIMTVIVIHVKAMQLWWFVLWRCYNLHLKPWTKQFYLVLFHKGIIYIGLTQSVFVVPRFPPLTEHSVHQSQAPQFVPAKIKYKSLRYKTNFTWLFALDMSELKLKIQSMSKHHTHVYIQVHVYQCRWKQYSCRLCAQFLTFTFFTSSLCPGCPWECCFSGCRANFAGWVTLTGSTFSMPGEPCSEREYSERVGATTKSFKEIKQSSVSRLHKYSYQNLHHLFMQQKIFEMNKAFITSFKWLAWRKKIPMLFPGDDWLGFVSMVPAPSGTSCMDLDIHSCLWLLIRSMSFFRTFSENLINWIQSSLIQNQ